MHATVEHQQSPFAGADVGQFVHALMLAAVGRNKNPPPGDEAGEKQSGCLGEADVVVKGRRALPVVVPCAEIPVCEQQAKLGAGAQVEFCQRVVQVSLDGLRRDSQTQGDLLVGVSQAGQCRHLLFAPRKGLPALPQVVFGLPALNTKSLSQQMNRATSSGERCSCSAMPSSMTWKRFVQLVIARFGFRAATSGGEEEYSIGPSIPLY